MKLKTGDVFQYPFLWRRESEKGETEGRKSRPACLAIALEAKGKTYLYILAITSKSPQSGQRALEIPDLELRRIGMNTDAPGWVIVSEYNRDILNDSFYLLPDASILGRFSDRFLRSIQLALRENLRSPAALVNRNL
ncbi:MAG: hypothetical protein ACRCU5_06230 [Rhizobiaceae bacterium]